MKTEAGCHAASRPLTVPPPPQAPAPPSAPMVPPHAPSIPRASRESCGAPTQSGEAGTFIWNLKAEIQGAPALATAQRVALTQVEAAQVNLHAEAAKAVQGKQINSAEIAKLRSAAAMGNAAYEAVTRLYSVQDKLTEQHWQDLHDATKLLAHEGRTTTFINTVNSLYASSFVPKSGSQGDHSH